MEPNNNLENRINDLSRELEELKGLFSFHRHTTYDGSRPLDGSIQITPGNFLSVGNMSIRVGTAIGSTAIGIYHGLGNPLNSVTANPGSIYMRQDGTASSSVYIKGSDPNSNTGWFAVSTASGSGSGTPAGNNMEIQFNDSGSFGADPNFLWDKNNDYLTLGTTAQGITIYSQAGNDGQNGGVMILQGGAGGFGGGSGGGIGIYGGDGTINGEGGQVYFQAGQGNGDAVGGLATLRGGESGGTANAGGVALIGGIHTGSDPGRGGDISITAGQTQNGTASGGVITIDGGIGGGSGGAGGSITITAGRAGSIGNASGGRVTIVGGAGHGTGHSGDVQIANSSLVTTAVGGFMLISFMSGTPTGSASDGSLVYDSSGNKLYIYNSGWRSVTLT